MTKAFLKLLTVAAAAALLSVSPATAQDAAEGGGDISRHELVERVTPELRDEMHMGFRGLTLPPAATVTVDPVPGTVVPPTVELHPVPDEIVAITPDVTGYHYYTHPDGSIVLVDPVTREIAMVLS